MIDEKGKFDELIEDKGVKILIDPKALMHVIGTKMDFVDDKLRYTHFFMFFFFWFGGRGKGGVYKHYTLWICDRNALLYILFLPSLCNGVYLDLNHHSTWSKISNYYLFPRMCLLRLCHSGNGIWIPPVFLLLLWSGHRMYLCQNEIQHLRWLTDRRKYVSKFLVLSRSILHFERNWNVTKPLYDDYWLFFCHCY